MKFLVLLIPFLFVSEMVQAETFRNSVVCLDCNYSEALQLIEQGPKLKMSCKNAQPHLPPTFENQLCYSQPEKRLVINAATGSVYGFEVSHRYQGVPLAEMEVSYRDITVPHQIQKLARDALDYHRSIQLALEKTARAMSQEVMASSVQTFANTVSSGSDCSHDGDAKALNEILDLSNESRLQNDVNSYFTRNFEDPGAEFESIKFTGAGFEVGRGSFGLSAAWQYVPSSKAITRVYFDSGSQLTGPEPYYPAKVVYGIQWDGHGVRLTLNPYQTIIDGYKFSAISNNKLPKSVKLSRCVAEVFKSFHGENMVVDAPSSGSSSGGGSDNGGGSDGGTSIPGVGGGSGGGGGSFCEVHLYDRDGKEISSFMIPC